jgi:23S rRNA (guanosine2251-2'-O)-methyltransferase
MNPQGHRLCEANMIILEGALSVKAALQYQRRSVEKVCIDQTKAMTPDFSYIQRQCEKAKVPFLKVSPSFIAELTVAKSHGGLIALCGSRIAQPETELLRLRHPLVLVIEGVEDPFNLGQIFRTAAIAGVDGIVMAQRDLHTAETTLMRSSGGLFDALPLVLSKDLAQTVQTLQASGYRFAAAYREAEAIDYLDYDFTQKVLLGIGGEMRGLSANVLALRDDSVKITYPTSVKVALNAVSATAVLTFEALRQRRTKPL